MSEEQRGPSVPPEGGLRQVVLGVGNPIMTDDRIGLVVAEQVAARLGPASPIEVRYSERGGFDLMDLLDGCDHAVVVDAYLVPDETIGRVIVRSEGDFVGSHHLYAAHGVDLPTALRLGRALGGDMPKRVDIVGVVVEDPYTVCETMTPAVEAAVELAVDAVIKLLNGA